MNEADSQTFDANTKKKARPTVYESAVDWWVGLLLILAPLMSAAIGVYAWWNGQPGDAMTLFIAGAVSSLVTAAFTVPCRYTVLDDAVSIRCGLICYQVPLSEIVSVERTASLKSGPSLSLKRVAIKTAKRTIIISPKDRDAFIADVMG
ncbi:hypothetical protein Poly51_43200 [Rubripirellula tenax]|uniref:Uncharacterized protein YyaB-like PH domain-containing protein n=1 Tax=Rubripirellula tenax TaxID=2528015 RepID=A0A5C6ETU9_9BACT|nr:PH domain-containing protein [Rubripirellula tenax]TWU51026.1 hypothetical protein Poly51_43200 [Rubripirellula tenax]